MYDGKCKGQDKGEKQIHKYRRSGKNRNDEYDKGYNDCQMLTEKYIYLDTICDVKVIEFVMKKCHKISL